MFLTVKLFLPYDKIWSEKSENHTEICVTCFCSVWEQHCLCGLVVRVTGYMFRGPGFASRPYQIIWEVVGLERGLLRLVTTIEELLGRKSSGSDLQNWEYCHRDPSRWPRGTLYPQKLAVTSPTGGCRSVGIVRSRTRCLVYQKQH
jgi:hypothetical protein